MRRNDQSKQYAWIVLAFLAVGCVWFGAPLAQRQWEDSVARDRSEATSEQGLHTLDEQLNGAGAPGQAINLSMDSGGAYSRKKEGDINSPESALYQPPAENQTANAASGAPINSNSGGTLADALKDIAKSGDDKNSSKHWGGQTARSGFTVPKANFNVGLSGLGAASGGTSAGGSSFANANTGITPFGTGNSNPIEDPTLGAPKHGTMPSSRGGALGALKDMQSQVARAAGSANYDAASGAGARAFDAAGKRQGGDNYSPLGGAPIGSDHGVPDNLKADDPRLRDKIKDPPKIDKPKDSKDPNQLKQEQQLELEKTLLQVGVSAIAGGIMGPMGAALGAGMMKAMDVTTPPWAMYGPYGGYPPPNFTLPATKPGS